MNRRDVVKLLSLAGLAAICPAGVASVSAGEPKYKGPYWIMLNAGGGWDPTQICDAKGGKLKNAADPDQGFTDDSLKLYRGPLRDNEGNVVLKEGQVIANDDNAFKLNVKFIVEGGVGKTGLKN